MITYNYNLRLKLVLASVSVSKLVYNEVDKQTIIILNMSTKMANWNDLEADCSQGLHTLDHTFIACDI
mgnify:FL=1